MTKVLLVLNVAVNICCLQQTVLKHLYSDSQHIGLAVGAALLAVTRNMFSMQ